MAYDFRKGLYKGIIQEVANEMQVQRQYVYTCIKKHSTEREMAIFRKVIEKMKERKSTVEDKDELMKEFESLW